MTGLALQIDGKWAVLSEGDSVNIENNSPVWGEGNSFSLPFELDIEANRHILGNADQITGQSVYEVLDGKRAVLYTLGIPVYYGKIKMEDEVELSEGKVDVTLVSGNLTFDEMIDGMNCQDVELLDRIVIGERAREFTVKATDGGVNSGRITGYFPDGFMWTTVDGVSTTNVSRPYPQAKYCNIRVCYAIPEENQEGEDYDLSKLSESYRKLIDKIYNPEMFGKNVVLDENRPQTSVCFYVLYFLDCLFKKKLGFDFSNEGISYIEDFCRLAFVTTKCKYDEVDTGIVVDNFGVQRPWAWTYKVDKLSYVWEVPLKHCVVNSKNFPDVDVSEVIDGMKNGFGIRFLFSDRENSAKCILVRDVLRDNETYSIPCVEIYDISKVENSTKGFRLTYNGADDDTNYNYTDWGKNAVLADQYNKIAGNVTENNKHLYIDTRIGNAYRIKIDEEATKSSEKSPSLFEVGAYNAAEFGDCSNEDNTEIVEVGFTPVTMNDVYFHKRRGVLRSIGTNASRALALSSDENPDDTESPEEDGGMAPEYDDNSINDQMFAYFMDVSMKYPSWVAPIKLGFRAGRYTTEINYTYFDDQRYDEARTDQSKKAYNEAKKNRERVGNYITAEQFDNNSPIQELDTGFMLGIMRGPGNESGWEDFDEDYDDEGNFRYVMTSKNSAFHSDTVDNYARVWDYNGTADGGVDHEGRISLKLRAEKPNPEGGFYPITESYAQRRGLFDKFYSEYAYFVVNRKIVRMKCRMEMADLLNIDWTKRYKIGEYVGFINKYSYSVSSTGISDVELEMYYI